MNLRSRLSEIPCPSGTHQVDMLIRKGSLKPSDDSPFANEIFDPEGAHNRMLDVYHGLTRLSATDTWFSLPSSRAREQKLAEYKPTNYGVVNPYTLENVSHISSSRRCRFVF